MQDIDTHTYFLREIMNIKNWYLTTKFAYESVSLDLSTKIEQNSIVQEIVDNAYGELNSNPVALLRRFSVENLKTCKELTLIRVISALEVFLINSINELFNNNKNPFMTQDIIEYHVSELLSISNINELQSKYIEKKCRQLHSAGFREINKFYKKLFSIDFRSFQTTTNGKTTNLETIEMYHDLRHILVHKLGKIDEQFTKKYTSHDKKVVTLTNDDIIEFFKTIMAFSDFVNKRLDKYKIIESVEVDYDYNIKIDLLDSTSYMIEPYFKIRIKKKNYELSEILDGIIPDPDYPKVVTIKFKGDYHLIRKYCKVLKRIMSKGDIKIIEDNTMCKDIKSPFQKKKLRPYPMSDVQLIMNELPERPWERHIHKKIAEKLGWSNSKVGNIINLLTTEHETKIQLKEKAIEMSIGEEQDLEVLVSPTDAKYKFLSWKSSNPSVVKVENGHIVALDLGTANITVNINTENRNANCKISVNH